MGTRIALAARLLLCVLGFQSKLCDDAEQRLVAAAEQTRQWLASGDVAAAIERIPDDLFPEGANGKRAAAALDEKVKAGAMELARHMRWDPPGPIRSLGNRHVCVMTYESKSRGKAMRACQIAVSDDGGRTWGFLSGSSRSIDGLRELAPELLAAIEDDIQAVELDGVAAVDSGAWDRTFRAPELPQGSGSVNVSFAWPDRLRRRVTRTMTRIIEGPGSSTRYRSTMSYDMTGVRTGHHYAVSFENVEVTGTQSPAEQNTLLRLDHAVQCLGDWPVSFVVEDPAVAPRLTNLSEVSAELRRRYSALPGVDTDPSAGRTINLLLSEPVLTQRALETWNRVIQVWHGNTLELGVASVSRSTSVMGGVTVETELTYSAHGSPLPGEVSGKELLRLHIRQVPKADITALAESARLPWPAGQSPLAEVTTWVDTSPDLVPERFVKLLLLKVDYGGSGESARSGTRWEFRFDEPGKQ